VDELKAGDAESEAVSPDEVCIDPSCERSEEEQAEIDSKKAMFKAIGVGAAVSMLAGIVGHDFVAEHEALALTFVFTVGYAAIIFEEGVEFNKSGVALLTAVGMWTVRAVAAPDAAVLDGQLAEALADVGEIIFFLLGAMTIVETVDAHQGFKLVTDVIKTRNARQILWTVGGITFFMSAVLDNLTSTIVMVSLLRKLVPDAEQRKFIGAVVVIAANAGGAWTPIGDVTTTMLWINGQITTQATMTDLVLPSMVSLLVPLALISTLSDEVNGEMAPMPESKQAMAPKGTLVFGAGVAALLFVPIFKTVTGLPPYMGMLAGLGGMWLLTDAIHFGEPNREDLKVPSALQKIDTQGILFFLGILMAISSLDSAGVLKDVAVFLDNNIPSTELIATAIGLASAVIDNVPLVAATMGMYDVADFPVDDKLWQLIAYCAGTGGSILIIGSAAGVAFMGMEKADFAWYTKKVSPWALTGYLGGIGTYLALHSFQLPVLADVTTSLLQ